MEAGGASGQLVAREWVDAIFGPQATAAGQAPGPDYSRQWWRGVPGTAGGTVRWAVAVGRWAAHLRTA